MSSAFRRAAHRRLVADPQRGRLLLQLSYLAIAESTALYDPYAYPPVRWDELSPELRAEVEEVEASGRACWKEAARLGVTGGADAAFEPVRAAVRPLLESAADRDQLAWEIARALERGAILLSPTCTVGPLCHAVGRNDGAFAAYRDPGGVMLNEGDTSAEGAAAAFVGERGAGVEHAREALERWEQRRGEEAAA